jgi:MFS family permease
MAGYAFAAFSAMMALVRFAGDPMRTRLGDVRMMQISAALAVVGFLIAGLMPILPNDPCRLCHCRPRACQCGAHQLCRRRQGAGYSARHRHFDRHLLRLCGLLIAPPLIGFVAEHVAYRHLRLVSRCCRSTACLSARTVGLVWSRSPTVSPLLLETLKGLVLYDLNIHAGGIDRHPHQRRVVDDRAGRIRAHDPA